MLAALGFTIVLSFFAATSVFAQDIHSEEYMQQHDGGDRAEYLQELEHSDPYSMCHQLMTPVFQHPIIRQLLTI